MAEKERISMNKRNLRLEQYGISRKRYKELCGFCEQYPDWKLELENHTSTVKCKQLDGMPHLPAGNASDPTSELAIRRSKIQANIRLIERTANDADPTLSKYIIKSVCYEQPFWYIRDIMQIPCSEHSFYDSRRYFFYLLDQRK